MRNFIEDPLWYPEKEKERYLIDILWFNHIHCRHPQYRCINFIEFYILDDHDDIIDSVKLYSEPICNRFYETDKETYSKIKQYLPKEMKN